MAAYILTETNLTGGLSEFNALFPTGPYRLHVDYKLLNVPRIQLFTPQLTNDFATADPVFSNTNASPPEVFHLEEPTALAGTFYFLVIGEEGASYAIEASETLTNWTALGRISTPLGAAYYFDSNVVATLPHRFYRARKE